MNNFTRRLKYYGIGFGIGLIMVFFFFGNRGCNWGPENRVKSSIRERVLVVNSENLTELKKKGISTQDLQKIIEESDIDFGLSKKEESLKVYLFTNEKFKFIVSLPYESFIAEVSLLNIDALNFTTSKKGKGKFLSFPKEKDIMYVNEGELLTCQMREMGIKDNNMLFEIIKKTGELDFSASNFESRPKAEHIIRFTDNKKRKVAVKTIWMKEKIEVISFNFDTLIPCK